MGLGISSISSDSITVQSIGADGIARPIQIPSGALDYYDYAQSSAFEAITELVERNNSLSTTRASDVNADQLNFTVKTYVDDFSALIPGSSGGVLIQGGATNLIPFSQDFDNAAWTKSGGAIITNGTTSPDGTSTAKTLSGLLTSTTTRIQDSVLGSDNVDGRTFTGTLYVKADGNVGDTVNLRLKRNAGGSDLSTNLLVTLTADWVRHDLEFTGVTDNLGMRMEIGASATTTADSCLIWQADVVEIDFVSSPIFTAGVADDRILDDSRILTDNFPDDNFKLTMPFKFKGSNSVDGRIAVSGTVFDLHYDDANTRYELIAAGGTVVSNSITPSFDDEITIVAEVDSVNGATLTVNGSTGPLQALVTSISWASTLRWFNSLAGTEATNAILHTSLVKPN